MSSDFSYTSDGVFNIFAPAASYLSFVNPISLPQLVSTYTSCPLSVICLTEFGVNPTRCSLFFTSLGSPTINLNNPV